MIRDILTSNEFFRKTKIDETKSFDKLNFILVTGNSHKKETEMFKQSCEKHNVNFIKLDLDKMTYFDVKYGKIKITNLNDNTSYIIEKDNSAIFIRHAISSTESDEAKHEKWIKLKDFRNFIISHGFKISNKGEINVFCGNRKNTYNLLYGKAPVADSLYITKDFYNINNFSETNNIKNYISSKDYKFPVVVKPVTSGHTCKTAICKDADELSNTMKLAISKSGEIIIQKYCDIENEIGVHVLCASMDTTSANEDDYKIIGVSNKKNKHLPDNFEISSEIKDIAIKSAKAIGAVYCSVVMCYDKLTNKYYVLKIESTPALSYVHPIEHETSYDMIISKLLNYFKKSSEIKNNPRTAGLIEHVKVVGLGEMTAKLDSGNASLCRMTTNKLEFSKDEKYVTWDFNGEEVKSRILYMKSIVQDKDPRPVIELDLIFNNKLFKNQKVALKKRNFNKKYEYILLSNKIIAAANVVIDCSKIKQLNK